MESGKAKKDEKAENPRIFGLRPAPHHFVKACPSFFLLFVSLISIVISGLAQSQPTTPSSDPLEAALAIPDPATRIGALQQFLKASDEKTPEKIQAAHEAIVTSYAQLAEAQLAENNIEKSVAGFRQAIAALPANVSDRFFVETVMRIPQTVALRGYRIEAIELARQIEKRYAEAPRRLDGLGEFYMAIEAPVDAIRALESAVALNNEAVSHRLLAAAYRIGLRLDDAIAEIQYAIKIDPKDNRAYYELANLYRAHGAYLDAINLYKKQLSLDPNNSPSIKGLALTYLAHGDESQARAALGQVREEITKDLYLQTQMAFYYLERGKLNQARSAADVALSLEPRYAWARIAAAETDLAEGKYFDAERNLLAARQYAGFPTLFFTIGKLYLAVEDFEGALDQFAKGFNYSPQKQFTTRLGGVLEVQAENLRELLSREHQAAIFLADSPTTDDQFKMIESLVRFTDSLRAIKTATKADAALRQKQLLELDRAATGFIEAERTRRAFRSLYIAQELANSGIATGTAIELADQTLGMATSATEFDGSLRDLPNYDRNGRLMIFRGRALDAKGWALFKSERNQEAISVLSEAVKAYGSLPESKRAIRHLATALEAAGELPEALKLYLAGYEPPSSPTGLDVNRTIIEGLYRKVHGSLDGLDEQLRRAGETTSAGLSALLDTVNPSEKTAEKKTSSSVPASPITTTPPTPTPIVLPETKSELNISIPQASPSSESLLSPGSKIAIESKEPPPPPLQPKSESPTRKRRVAAPGPYDESRAEKPQAGEPQVYTRKRRVVRRHKK
jgi:tetratricopeptide (TPR) repeat protein